MVRVVCVLARLNATDRRARAPAVSGVFTGDPSQRDSRKLDVITSRMLELGEVSFGAKSSMGRGGMESKVNSAAYAMQGGVSTVIADGLQWRSMLDLIDGKPIGTLFSDE